MSNVMEALRSREFTYQRPWFYNHPMALRCELGMGEGDQYLKNAGRRAEEIYGILFDGPPDAFFFHHCFCDYDGFGDFDLGAILRWERRSLTFALEAQKRYRHTVVRDICFDREDDPDTARINRIICYPDESYDAQKQIRRQLQGQEEPPVSFVSEKQECIFSIYDDRGCDIVFFSKEKLREFYPMLRPYFLEYDLAMMEERLRESGDVM